MNKRKVINIILSLSVAIGFFLLTYCCLGVSYQTNDDAQLANIAAGGYGDWRHMIYVNSVFSLLLRPLYAVHYANWYVIVQLVLMVIAVAVSAYIILKKSGTVPGLIMVSALMVAFSEHIFYSFQYTECSFILATAGLLVLVDNLGNLDWKTGLGIGLVAFGTMIRWNSFYAAGAMAAPLLLVAFFRQTSKEKKSAVISMLLLFAVTFGLKLVDMQVYNSDRGWKEFVQYNSARTGYSDYRVFSLPQENPFTDKGISDIDYTMLNNWDFYDKARFDTELLNELSEHKRHVSARQIASETIQTLKNIAGGKSYNYMFAAVAVFSLVRLRLRSAAISMTGVYGMFTCLIAYLTYNVRLPSWVISGMIWTLAVFALYCVGDMRNSKLFTSAAALVMLVYIVNITYPGLVQAYNNADANRQGARVGYEYIDRMSRDKENLYLLSTGSALESAGMDITSPRADGYFSNIVTYGDWLSRAPHRDEALAAYNVERPLVDAVNNPHVYLDAKRIDLAVQYTRQELGTEVIAVKTGKNEYAPYQLITETE